MVKVRAELPPRVDGRLDLDAWLLRLQRRTGWEHVDDIRRALDAVQRAGDVPHRAWHGQASCLEAGIAIVDLLAQMQFDRDSAVCGLLYPAVRQELISPARVGEVANDGARALLEGLARLSPIDTLSLATTRLLAMEAKDQLHNVRRMLVAMIDDVRAPVIKLAERTAAIRVMKNAAEDERRQIATQVLEVFAPLSHRLGIGQLRWELEDYAFRFLEPDAYRRIAAMLDERREGREQFLDTILAAVRRELKDLGIQAEVSGRVKHLYGIWRKMQRKGVDIQDIHDVRAIRVIVDDVQLCYSVLGAVHTKWRHIPREFDDYIANPKSNNYRSLHTAVIGPGKKVLEVQIRTMAMHLEAELGICAHWAYKDGLPANRDVYQDKLDWLRQVLDRQDAPGVLDALSVELQHQFTEDRIYVFTPSGAVVDMMAGATPIDFAYRIHTSVGEHCFGARIDGRGVELQTPLETGQTVEILTSDSARPNVQWLNPELGYVRSERARAKIRGYFRERNRRRLREDGQRLLLGELSRLGMVVPPEQLARALSVKSVAAMHAAIGAGEIPISAVLDKARELLPPASGSQQLLLLPRAGASAPRRVRGTAGMPVTFASCCRPQPGQEIVGIVRADRVVVHLATCARLERSAGKLGVQPARLEWDKGETRLHFELSVEALDRSGLLADVAGALSRSGINVLASQTQTDRDTGRATIEFRIETARPENLGRAIDRIERVANVLGTVCRAVNG